MIQELLLSTQWVDLKLIPPHTQSIGKLFSMVVVLTVTRILSHITMHRVFMYQKTTLKMHSGVQVLTFN